MDEAVQTQSRQPSGVSLKFKWKNPWVICDMCGETVPRRSGVQKHCRRCAVEAEQAHQKETFLVRYRSDLEFRQYRLESSRAWKKRHPDNWRRYYTAEKQRQKRSRQKLRQQAS